MLQDIFLGTTAGDKTGTPAREAGNIINNNFAYLAQSIQAQLVDSTLIGGVTTSSAVPSTGNIHAIGVGPGTYTNWGGMVVPANNIATLQRVDGTYSMSLTPIDLSGKLNVSDLSSNLNSTETDKALNLAGAKDLSNAIGTTTSTTFIELSPNNILESGSETANVMENQWAETTEEKNYFDISFIRRSGTSNVLVYVHTGATFTLLATLTPLDNGDIQTFRVNEVVPIGSRIAVVGNIGFSNNITGVGLAVYNQSDFSSAGSFPTWDSLYKVKFFKETITLNNVPELIQEVTGASAKTIETLDNEIVDLKNITTDIIDVVETKLPNNALISGMSTDLIMVNQWGQTTEDKDYFDISFIRNSGTASVKVYAYNETTFTLLATLTPLDNGNIQTFRINQIVQSGFRIGVQGNIGFESSGGVTVKIYNATTFASAGTLTGYEGLYKIDFYKLTLVGKSPLLFPKYPSLYNKIGISGTSITYGVGATGGHGGTAKWLYLFNQTLNNVLGRTVTIVDGGVSGQTSAGMLSNLPALISANPQIFLLEMAINDAKIDGNGQTLSQSNSNYRSMISLIKAANIVPVLFTGWPLDLSNTSLGDLTLEFSQSKRTDLNNLARKLSTELNVQLIDLDLVCSQNYDLLNDGLHPNDRGHLWGANVISAGVIQNGTV